MQDLGPILSELSHEIAALRQEMADLRSELRSVREQNSRQDQEIWGSDGLSRFSALGAEVQRMALQIKGIWAALSAGIGLLLSIAISRLR